MTKLTHKEHMVRAMLMGRIYDWTDGTYCERHKVTGDLDIHHMVDAGTLEPIGTYEATARRLNGRYGYHWTEPPMQETDWARMDDD